MKVGADGHHLAGIAGVGYAVEQFGWKAAARNRLDQYDNITAAGQPGLPCGIIGNAIAAHLVPARCDHLRGNRQNVAFNAATRYRTHKAAIAMDQHVCADRAGRRTPGFDHGGNGHRGPRPAMCRRKDMAMICCALSHCPTLLHGKGSSKADNRLL